MQLVLFTQDYPYGKGEPYLESEIEYASQAFNKVLIVSCSREMQQIRPVPDNVQAVKLSSNYRFFRCLLYAIRKLFSYEMFKEASAIRILDSKPNIKSLVEVWLKTWMLEKRYLLYFKNLAFDKNETIAYSYWMDSRAYFIAKHNKCWKYAVSRAHRYEVWEGCYNPFRKMIDSGLDRIYFISDTAKQSHINLMTLQYKNASYDKYTVSRLGVNANVNKEKSTMGMNKVFHIASCSVINQLKRLDLIIEMLSEIKGTTRIRWTHLGWGEQGNNIKAKSIEIFRDSNIECEFIGQLSNSMINEFYQTNQIDLFINVSDIEGVPVSIMEAMSFGIPCIARDVGGISEIVVEGVSGYLMKSNPTPEEIAGHIQSIVKYWKENDTRYLSAGKVKQFIVKNYNAETNYSNFFKTIKEPDND